MRMALPNLRMPCGCSVACRAVTPRRWALTRLTTCAISYLVPEFVQEKTRHAPRRLVEKDLWSVSKLGALFNSRELRHNSNHLSTIPRDRREEPDLCSQMQRQQNFSGI